MQRIILSAIMLVAVSLAGCAGGDDVQPDTPDQVDRDTFQLEAGKGAIAGLLVDDRFRPIHLVDNPTGEFQTTGFILLQETGKEVKTNENGEFTFTNLNPGSYTLRVTAAGHEAIPQRVAVVEGVFAEESVVARRIVSDSGFILIQEYTMFTACAAEALVVSHAAPCGLLDASGDSSRVDLQLDYSAYQNEATAMVTEFRFNQDVTAGTAIRVLGAAGGLDATYYAEADVVDGNYVRMLNIPGEVSEQGNRNVEFTLAEEFQTIMFPYSATHQHFDDFGFFGVGVALGVQAQVVQSVFLGEPEVDLDTYCVLC